MEIDTFIPKKYLTNIVLKRNPYIGNFKKNQLSKDFLKTLSRIYNNLIKINIDDLDEDILNLNLPELQPTEYDKESIAYGLPILNYEKIVDMIKNMEFIKNYEAYKVVSSFKHLILMTFQDIQPDDSDILARMEKMERIFEKICKNKGIDYYFILKEKTEKMIALIDLYAKSLGF